MSEEPTTEPAATSGAPESGAGRAVRIASFVFCGVVVVMLAAWITSDPRTNLETDWTAFDNAGDRLFNDGEIYRPHSEAEPLPYLYPPSALWLVVPLRVVGFYGSYLLSLAFALATTFVAVRLLLALGGDTPDRRAAFTVAMTSGFVVSSAVIGQYAGLWLLGLALGLSRWVKGDHLLAGMALALLFLKPNLGLAVPVVLIWSRSWRVLAGSALGGVLLLVASAPFGLERWRGFGRNLRSTAEVVLEGRLFESRMITVRASVEMATDLDPNSALLTGVWLAVAGVTGVAVLQLWRPSMLAASLPRAFAALTLFLVAASPRLYFYDGLILTVAGLAWWGTRASWRLSARAQRVSGVLIAGLCVMSWGGVFFHLNFLTGPLSALLLMTWAADSLRNTSEERFEPVDAETPLQPA